MDAYAWFEMEWNGGRIEIAVELRLGISKGALMFNQR